ncbi:MAG: hypothetical protein OJF51_000897 [Nitrospira sp.]|nr:MAG: hypothetical protein OJF51_000897 [Nitrospira sp.]
MAMTPHLRTHLNAERIASIQAALVIIVRQGTVALVQGCCAR